MPSLRIPLCLSIVAFAVLACLANGFPFIKDAGELASSLHGIGVAHPTGFPVQHCLAPLLDLLPVGSISFRLSLLSALGGAAVFLLTVLLVVRLTGLAQGRGGAVAMASVAGGALLSCDTIWFHLLNVEVYIPSLALSALLLLVGLSGQEEEDHGLRRPALLGLLGGLAVGMHVTCVMVFALVAGAGLISRFLWGRHRAGGGRLLPAFGAGALFLVLGSAVILYLPVRAMQEPLRNWGDPSTSVALLGHLSGRSIRSSFSTQMLAADPSHLVAHGGVYLRHMWEQAGSLLPLSLVGLLLIAKRRPMAGLTILSLLAGDALFSISVNPMGQAEKQTSTISLFVLALLAASGAVLLLARLHRMSLGRLGALRLAPAGAGTVVAVLMLAWSPVSSLSWPARMSRVSDLGYFAGRRAFATTGPQGVLVTNQDDLSASALYLAEVEKRRPDLLHLIKQMVCDHWATAGPLARTGAVEVAGVVEEVQAAACKDRGREDMVEAWFVLHERLSAMKTPVAWELGSEAVDTLFQSDLAPGYPCAEVVWGMEEAEGNRRLARFFGGYRTLLEELGPGLQDDMGGNSMAEFQRLSAAFLLMRPVSPTAGDVYTQAACALLHSATILAPRNCQAWNNLAVCQLRLGRLEEAIAAAGIGADACPLYVTVRVNLVRLFFLGHRTEEAFDALADLTRHFPASEYEMRLERLRKQLITYGFGAEAEALERALAQEETRTSEGP